MHTPFSVALLHGAGYAGREIIRWLAGHPSINLKAVTSRTYSGKRVDEVYRELAGITELVYCSPEELLFEGLDAVLISAEHGKSAALVQNLLEKDFRGGIVDLSADFRLTQPDLYKLWYKYEHPAPHLLHSFNYGLVEGPNSGIPYTKKYIANPGCFATAIGLGLWPIARNLPGSSFAVTALTGASGSGARAKPTTHFPDRDGNVRAYKVLQHQHIPEILLTLGEHTELAFVPASGPWTRGIWGTAQITLPGHIDPADINLWYDQAYAEQPLVRCYPGNLPEQRHVAFTPFCDIGWVIKDRQLVIGFTLDNLLKGAATQAIQNLNILFDLDHTCGLLPQSIPQPASI